MSNEVVFEYTGIEEKSDIPKDVTIVRFHSNVTEVGDGMFKDCNVKKVVLNEGLKKIGDESFYYCKSLESINFPSTLVEINDYAFRECDNLRGVRLNDGLTKIGGKSFQGCYQLEHINLPSTVTEIGDYAFYDCSGLKDVMLNGGLQRLGSLAFAHCRSLECITIPHTVTEISDRTFFNCTNLREVVLNEGLKKIEDSEAFYHCSSLECITFPSTLTKIGSLAFNHCSRLREVGLHEGIENIGYAAFNNYTSLERIVFPNLSNRLDTIIQAGKYANVENKIDEVRVIVDRRASEMFLSAVALAQGSTWGTVKEILCRIDQLLTYYEVREATTLFELAMWKSKIDQAEENLINRDAHRIDIPGPVRDTILQYLDFRV